MSSIVLCCITLHLAASLAAESRNQAWEVLKDEALREEYDRKWREIMEPAVLADECRRAGNELYRAACLLAQKHADAHGDGVTFGGEGAADQTQRWTPWSLEPCRSGLGEAGFGEVSSINRRLFERPLGP